MKLLKNRRAFLRWAEHDVGSGATREWGYLDDNGEYQEHKRKPLKVNIPEPSQYPCWAYAVVQSYGYEEERPEYLYTADLDFMQRELARATP